MIEAASELLQGHRYTPEWWSRTRDIRRHSCVRTPQFRSRAVEWTRRAIWGPRDGNAAGEPPRSPFDPASWRSDRLEHKDDSSANYNGRKSTTPVDTTGGWASTAPATGQGKANNAASSLAQSQGRERERERDHHGRSPHGRSSSRTRPSRWEPMQPPAQVQNAELPAERQRLELRRRAMDGLSGASSTGNNAAVHPGAGAGSARHVRDHRRLCA